jgi:hypothetical protein
MIQMPTRPIKILFLILPVLLHTAFAKEEPSRMVPPARTECSPNHLTSYSGKVVEYQRTAGHTRLRIATDWGPIETVRLPHPEPDNPAARYLIEGKAFAPSDWQRIEISSGRLRKGVRAAAWVCSDSHLPIIDWLPPKE